MVTILPIPIGAIVPPPSVVAAAAGAAAAAAHRRRGAREPAGVDPLPVHATRVRRPAEAAAAAADVMTASALGAASSGSIPASLAALLNLPPRPLAP